MDVRIRTIYDLHAHISWVLKGVVGTETLVRKKIEQVFEICKCAEDEKTLGLANANQIPWSNVKAMMTTEYCPATEIEKMEQELWTLTLKGDDIEAYSNRFHELVLMCPELMPTESKKIGNNEAINMARAHGRGNQFRTPQGQCPKARNQQNDVARARAYVVLKNRSENPNGHGALTNCYEMLLSVFLFRNARILKFNRRRKRILDHLHVITRLDEKADDQFASDRDFPKYSDGSCGFYPHVQRGRISHRSDSRRIAREQNKLTIKNRYPLPRIDDLFDQLQDFGSTETKLPKDLKAPAEWLRDRKDTLSSPKKPDGEITLLTYPGSHQLEISWRKSAYWDQKIVQETTEKIISNQGKIKTARIARESYADKRRNLLNSKLDEPIVYEGYLHGRSGAKLCPRHFMVSNLKKFWRVPDFKCLWIEIECENLRFVKNILRSWERDVKNAKAKEEFH
ncbi:putative reverse transcriptase domain-containing protein [Tanacetum coccineum]